MDFWEKPFQRALQKVRGFVVGLKKAGLNWFRSLNRHIPTPKAKRCQGQIWTVLVFSWHKKLGTRLWKITGRNAFPVSLQAEFRGTRSGATHSDLSNSPGSPETARQFMPEAVTRYGAVEAFSRLAQILAMGLRLFHKSAFF